MRIPDDKRIIHMQVDAKQIISRKFGPFFYTYIPGTNKRGEKACHSIGITMGTIQLAVAVIRHF